MKNFVGLMVLIFVVAGCSFLNKKEETNNSTTTSNTATKTETTPSSDTKAAGLTLEKFNELKNGMKYDEVVKVLGSEGTETSSYSSGSLKTVTYKWEGENYARITVTFRNDELTSKIQSGLKSANSSSSSSANLTMAKYNELKNGITYEEAVKIIGSEGTQSSSSSVGNIKIASYKWEGDKYARIFATFRDNKLTSKSQSNLK